jgi:teichoic acid transport system permease protein
MVSAAEARRGSAVEETDYGAIARSAGLTRVGSRPTLSSYISETWQRRAFAVTLARYRIEAANQQNRLGLAWVVIRPLLNAVVYGVIFGIILTDSTRPANFIPFLVVGVFIFEFFSDAFLDGAKSITSNAQLVKSLSFPRILLPIASVIQSVLELVPMLVVMIGIVLISGEPVTANWLLAIPILALMTLFNAGVAFIAARLTVHFRDFTQIVPFITRILFYASGIFFSIDLVLADQPAILAIAQLNPVHDFIALIRGAFVSGSIVYPFYWTVVGVSAVVVFVFGFIYFWRAEEQYGRD